MNAAIVSLFQQYRELTGDASAAAALTVLELQNKQPTERDTFGPRDVAKRLSVSPATVIEWIRSGQLKAANIATGPRPRFVIKPEDLATFLDNRQPMPPAPRRRHRPQTTSKRF
jgi:transposase